jgi:hypothetical protein
MADLLFTVLTLTIALLFTRYMAYYIVYFVAKFIKFISKGKINMVIHPITFGDVLCTAMMCLLLSSIFKIAGII